MLATEVDLPTPLLPGSVGSSSTIWKRPFLLLFSAPSAALAVPVSETRAESGASAKELRASWGGWVRSPSKVECWLKRLLQPPVQETISATSLPCTTSSYFFCSQVEYQLKQLLQQPRCMSHCTTHLWYHHDVMLCSLSLHVFFSTCLQCSLSHKCTSVFCGL